MAEFQEVMLQAKRMCSVFSKCNECPLLAMSTHECRLRELVTILFRSDSSCPEIANIENIILEWAKKNPAPRYPTFKEHTMSVLPTISPIYMVTRCVCELYGESARAPRCDGAGRHEITCQACWNREMSAKIAREIGAEKKQRTEDIKE